MGNDYYMLMTDTSSNNLCENNICVRSKFITIILDTTYCIMSVFDRKHLISLSFALNGYFSCREMFTLYTPMVHKIAYSMYVLAVILLRLPS